jgi:hypothetical protein
MDAEAHTGEKALAEPLLRGGRGRAVELHQRWAVGDVREKRRQRRRKTVPKLGMVCKHKLWAKLYAHAHTPIYTYKHV